MAARAACDRFILLGDFRPVRGNVVFLVEGECGPRVLKIYRPRRSPLRESMGGVGQRVFERKTGSSARARWRTEAALLDLWRREGFDVPARLAQETPAGFGPLATWMEYCPGPTLSELLMDDGVPWTDRLELVERLGRECGRRLRTALERSDSRFVQEHATLNHVVRFGARLVTIDLEASYRRTAPPLDAAAHELAGILRSLEKRTGERFDVALRSFVRGFGGSEVLHRAASRASRTGSLRAALWRWQDRRKRGDRGKTWVLGRLAELIAPGATPPHGVGEKTSDEAASP